jgi:hypothetical protein
MSKSDASGRAKIRDTEYSMKNFFARYSLLVTRYLQCCIQHHPENNPNLHEEE